MPGDSKVRGFENMRTAAVHAREPADPLATHLRPIPGLEHNTTTTMKDDVESGGDGGVKTEATLCGAFPIA